MNIEVRGASWSIDAKRIVDTISLRAQTGEFIGLIGPNGSGKSSLLRLIYRMYPPDGGLVLLDGHDIWKMSGKVLAQYEAVVAQENVSKFDFTVEEIVFMGRTPHKRLFDLDTAEDDAIVYDALCRVGMQSFTQRIFRTLSGGEKQRVLIARALAQQAKVLVLDEPINHLDIRSQLETMELVRSLGVTTIVALHDLNLAAAYCDRLYLMQSGRIVAQGHPSTVLTPPLIESVYGVRAEIQTRPPGGRLHIIFTLNLPPAPASP
ncbi:MAG: ABC transporter ATP-binding protein [Anaerolineales bacterium]|nr:ABC transporter ATP-binding protein [Anaerolineales bacterium]